VVSRVEAELGDDLARRIQGLDRLREPLRLGRDECIAAESGREIDERQ
jgi:hypothetical protein